MFELRETKKHYYIFDVDSETSLIEFSTNGISGTSPLEPKEALQILTNCLNLAHDLNKIIDENLYNSDPQLFMQLVVPAIKGSK